MTQDDRDRLIPLCRVAKYMHADLIRQTLERAGIKCITEGEHFSALFGLSPTAPWAIRILVQAKDRQAALEVLQDIIASFANEVEILPES